MGKSGIVWHNEKRLIMNILFASSNVNKAKEYEALLASVTVTIHNADHYDPGEIVETGTTFAHNALLKATTIAKKAKKSAFADDGGLVIPDFPEMAGLYSARYAAKHGGFPHVFKHMSEAINSRGIVDSVPAFFECVIAFHDYQNDYTHTFSGRVDGRISFPPCGDEGFGYDSIFVPVGYDQTFAELGWAIKSRMSHRSRACMGFIDYLKKRGL